MKVGFLWEPGGVSAISPVPICLNCAISPTQPKIVFLTLRQASEIVFSTTEVKGCFFSSPKSEDIHTWASFIHFIHQTVALAFVPLRFVQLAWKQPRLQLLICPELMSFCNIL